jgi:prephenate dehydratase
MSVVAIQGIKGSYSEEAALNLLGDDMSIIECNDFADTFAAFESHAAEYLVVPVENKIVGAIQTPADILREKKLKILERLELKVRHVLVGADNSEFELLTNVRSHIEALKQCKRFLSAHPNLIQIVGADTAGSVRRIAEERDPQKSAIGSRRAAGLYGAKILHEDIADDIDNWTTFCLVGR